MHDLTTTQGIVALAAAGVGALALILALVLAFKLRRLRAAQKAVLGADGQRDLVTHAQAVTHRRSLGPVQGPERLTGGFYTANSVFRVAGVRPRGGPSNGEVN